MYKVAVTHGIGRIECMAPLPRTSVTKRTVVLQIGHVGHVHVRVNVDLLRVRIKVKVLFSVRAW